MFSNCREIYRYRSLLYNLVVVDQKARYKNTLLGFCWSFLNPLLLMAVFMVVFGKIGRFSEQIDNYPVFLLTGLLPWTFFTSTLILAGSAYRMNTSLLEKISFPREIMPLASVSTGLINFLYSLTVLIVLMLCFKIQPGWHLCYLPLIILLQSLMLVGAAYSVAIASAWFADVQYLLNIMLAILFYLTPIFYPVAMVPENLRPVFSLNPMVHFITAYHRILLYHKSPGIKTLLFMLAFSACLYLIGAAMVRKYAPRIPEIL